MVDSLLNSCYPLVMGGGFGMQLINDGYKAVDESPLWGTELIRTHPDIIEATHLKFLAAGAEIMETATYQISFEGFSQHLNLSDRETEECYKTAVKLSRRAIKKHQMKFGDSGRKILVAGNFGPYGAVLHDRSEYTGTYFDTVDKNRITTEHRKQISALVHGGVDLIAAETLPSTEEADIVIELMGKNFPQTPYYFSFVTHDGLLTPRGENLLTFLTTNFALSSCRVDMSKFVGIGINCSSLNAISTFIDSVKNCLDKLHPNLKFIFYPNLDEPLNLDGDEKRRVFWSDIIQSWTDRLDVARIVAIGGCCHVLDTDIVKIAQKVVSYRSSLPAPK